MARKRSLSSRLSRREPDDEEFADALSEILHSSDRVAAIMSSAMVEIELMNAIRASLEDGSDVAALFHSADAPFGSFKQRILAGKALGLYRAETVRDLDIIRDVRNQFAHALLKIDFENEHIAASCSELRDYMTWEQIEERDANAIRVKFEDVCMSIAIGLMRRTSDAYRRRANPQLPALGLPLPSGKNALLSDKQSDPFEESIERMLADTI
jgi:hypothetical protein